MDNVSEKLKEVNEWLQKEYSGIRTGQASPMLLDAVKVESYGSYMPINQVGSVNIEDARTLRISVWDKSAVSAIEKAIREADLGISTVSDSDGVRVIFPELTSERRVQLMKLAKAKLTMRTPGRISMAQGNVVVRMTTKHQNKPQPAKLASRHRWG